MYFSPFTPYTADTLPISPSPSPSPGASSPRRAPFYGSASPRRSASHAPTAAPEGKHGENAARSASRSSSRGLQLQGTEAHEKSNSPYPYHPLGTVERHHQEHTLQRAQEARRRRLAEAQIRHTCPFSPLIASHTAKIRSSAPDNAAVNLFSASHPGSVFERLLLKGQEREERLQLARWNHEQQNAKRQINGIVADHSVSRASSASSAGSRGEPFSPAINPRSARSAAKRVVLSGNLSVEDRLLHYGQCLHSKLRHRQQEATQQQTGASASPSRRTASQRQEAKAAFFARNARLLLERERKQFEAVQRQKQECTFHPKISPTSAAIDYESRRLAGADASLHSTAGGLSSSPSVPVSPVRLPDRSTLLYEEGVASKTRSAETAHFRQLMEEQLHHNHFSPRTNPVSEEWIGRSPYHQKLFEKNFLDRQELYQKVSQEEKQRLAQKIHTERMGPGMCRQDSVLRSAGENSDDDHRQAQAQKRLERLYNGVKQRSQETEVPEYTFQPQLSPGSQYVIQKQKDREKDVVKRLTSAHPRENNPLADALPAQDLQHSSSPVLMKREVEDFYQRQMSSLKRREFRVQEEQQRQQLREVLHCTFRPRTTGSSRAKWKADPAKPLASHVTGVSQFLQRQEAAKQLQQEKEKRMRRLEEGGGRPINGPSHTVFTPFHLETEHRSRVMSDPSNSSFTDVNGLLSSVKNDLVANEPSDDLPDGARGPADTSCRCAADDRKEAVGCEVAASLAAFLHQRSEGTPPKGSLGVDRRLFDVDEGDVEDGNDTPVYSQTLSLFSTKNSLYRKRAGLLGTKHMDPMSVSPIEQY